MQSMQRKHGYSLLFTKQQQIFVFISILFGMLILEEELDLIAV